MPQPQKYANEAQRQAAYRKRRKEAIKQQLAAKGFAPLPARPTVPGWPRWKQMMNTIECELELMTTEMEDYCDARTDRWKDSINADIFRDKIKALKPILDRVEDWTIGI